MAIKVVLRVELEMEQKIILLEEHRYEDCGKNSWKTEYNSEKQVKCLIDKCRDFKNLTCKEKNMKNTLYLKRIVKSPWNIKIKIYFLKYKLILS